MFTLTTIFQDAGDEARA